MTRATRALVCTFRKLSGSAHRVSADHDVVGLLVEEGADRAVLGGTAGIHGGEAVERLTLPLCPLGVRQGDRGGHGRCKTVGRSRGR
jgi:hypothetical protein